MDTLTIVVFKLGEEEYGLDIAHTQSIERITHTTRIPNTAEYVKGVINLRGNVMPIIDLRSKLGISQTQYTEETRVIIAKYDETELGLIVDCTSDVIDVNPNEIETTSTGNLNTDYFGGILKYDGRLIVMVKLKNLMQTNN